MIIFFPYFQVLSAKIVTNTKLPGAKCYGFITMLSKTEILKCIDNLNQTELHGQMIQVEIVRKFLVYNI